ncbi:hypothetical protein QVD17_03191 [Tagetes erecta]|uniref:Transferase, Chloramphenicol acetyltransferase-like domain protein n=1 Tax=Tagetes erecta TaxID=13708 RepID=A0AAD8P349_TARER|nr:hypothetical protein QVD17_03191 [Tagetes erecta]
MTMISNVIRFSRRHLHTIVSTENIKPSLPTPSHLKTYNLSVFDQSMPSVFNPLVSFYSNPANIMYHDQMLDQLKNSLSLTLTKYYPFAGRHAKISPTFVDCNDHGAVFIEASVDATLSDFLQNSRYHLLDPFFPYARTWKESSCSCSGNDHLQTAPLAVQINRFECGGVGLAVSLSHKIADGYSFIRFLSDWAKMTRVRSKNDTYHEVPIEPHFISFPNTSVNFAGSSLVSSNDCVTRSFVFPNANINELKHKVRGMTVGCATQPTVSNPTRVEVLIWLLYKCAVEAATKNNLGAFKPTSFCLGTNIRDKMIEPLPENTVGNFLFRMEVQTKNEMELTPKMLIGEFRNQKKKIKGIKNIEAVFAPLLNTPPSDFDIQERQKKFENGYVFTSLCGYPVNAVDFGWGSPLKLGVPGNLRKNSFILMDASNGEGIEVHVCLEKQDMDIVEKDPELLAFANISY